MPATATLDSRYSFTAQFLRGAGIFAKRAREIEATPEIVMDEAKVTEHRAVVVAAITQSSAALETEIAEVVSYGPGHHLGSNRVDISAQRFLSRLADIIDNQQTLDRYQTVLHLLLKVEFDPGRPPFQSAALLVRLRNELTHYKSKLGKEMGSIKLFKSLRQLKHARPPFVSPNSNFFPHHCLSADCASWSVRSAVTFIDAFYEKFGVDSPLKSQRADILGFLL